MTSLDEIRAAHRDHELLTSDAELDLFLHTINPATVGLERLAHASSWELNTARHVWRQS